MSWYVTSGKSLKQETKDLSIVNLDIIEQHISDIKKKVDNGDPLSAWMADKIATARNDLNDVNMGLDS